MFSFARHKTFSFTTNAVVILFIYFIISNVIIYHSLTSWGGKMHMDVLKVHIIVLFFLLY